MWIPLVLIIGMAISLSDSSMMRAYPLLEINQYHNVRTYCEYQGFQILPGSSFKTTDCMECACSENGLSCQGFGIAAGVFAMEIEGVQCAAIPNFCDILWARADDITKDCATGNALIPDIPIPI